MVKIKKEKIKLSAKDKIVKNLIENKAPQSIRSISGATLIDYKNTHNIINDLYPEVISKEKFAGANIVLLNPKINEEIFSVEEKRTGQFLIDHKQLELVKKDIESVHYPFFIVLVFGSNVKKTHTKESDIDLCIISDNKEKVKDLIRKLDLLPIKLEMHVFTTANFESMLKTKEENIGKEIIKNNIILYGTENYYNLIAPWMKKG